MTNVGSQGFPVAGCNQIVCVTLHFCHSLFWLLKGYDFYNHQSVAAFEIAAFVDVSKKDQAEDDTRFDIRIGINTGPVVAGVVGTQKFSYDIWGDTVNVASRMETMSEAGKINISENTYNLIKEEFEFEPRGEIYVKNRGMIKMYYVNGVKATAK